MKMPLKMPCFPYKSQPFEAESMLKSGDLMTSNWVTCFKGAVMVCAYNQLSL